MTDYSRHSILDLGKMLRSGEVTSVELTTSALDRISAVDPLIHAFITITPERALADAARADAELDAGRDRGPMHGIPYGCKDIVDTAGIRTTCHSRLLETNIPENDAFVIERLTAAGAVLLGKLATNEFAFAGPGPDLPFPLALNPWNRKHYTGGSSAGSVAGIMAGYFRAAIGSDTGGSIRGPAGWVGTVGLKPTYGLVSRSGVFPLSWTLDHLGPLARNVEDAAVFLQVLAGHDPEDPGSAQTQLPDYVAGLDGGVEGLRVGVPRSWFSNAPGADPEVIEGIELSLAALRDAGAVVEDVELPDFALFGAVCRVLLTGEGYAVHRQWAAERLRDYAKCNQERLLVGCTISGAQITDALRVRRKLVDQVNAVFADYDVLATGTVLQTSPNLDEIVNPMGSASPMQTTPWNVTGHPALSLPVKLSKQGFPTSMQIVGRAFDEATVLRVARALESRLPWKDVDLPEVA